MIYYEENNVQLLCSRSYIKPEELSIVTNNHSKNRHMVYILMKNRLYKRGRRREQGEKQ